MRTTLLVAWTLVGCRGYHERDQPRDTSLYSCLPYALECPSCTLDQDLALPDPIRHWRCEDPALGTLTGVTHRGENILANDEHYYDSDGVRVAAHRAWDDDVPICDKATFGTDEWWGEILDCAPTCEVDPTLELADPALPPCG
ncbi:MAG: hypothetical protein H6738_25085 [Alphaproteobacteria bacterium]|nr:hypothetical protein [Alphaproteobacteria bacterium]MCB9700087.1 hypothetical protein [Alphaproteobacteria bacterium]